MGPGFGKPEVCMCVCISVNTYTYVCMHKHAPLPLSPFLSLFLEPLLWGRHLPPTPQPHQASAMQVPSLSELPPATTNRDLSPIASYPEPIHNVNEDPYLKAQISQCQREQERTRLRPRPALQQTLRIGLATLSPLLAALILAFLGDFRGLMTMSDTFGSAWALRSSHYRALLNRGHRFIHIGQTGLHVVASSSRLQPQNEAPCFICRLMPYPYALDTLFWGPALEP